MSRNWQLRRELWQMPAEGAVMGILNVTPDSFSDGGAYIDPKNAVCRAEEMVREGANVIDLGGESTRPGSSEVPPEEEIRRILPVLKELRRNVAWRISVDTRHVETARAALEAGADIINDVNGLRDPAMAKVCAQYGCGVVVMHMKGEPKTMQNAPVYEDVVAEVRAFFEERLACLTASGVNPACICWDPGLGFGKTTEHNLRILARLETLRVGDLPMMMALSRKRFLGDVLGDADKGRGTVPIVAASLYAAAHGADIHRVHEAGALVDALRMCHAAERMR